MPDNPWSTLAREYGPRAVMNPTITDAEYETETARQIKIIFPLLAGHLTGYKRAALDYGCGSGRFTGPLNRLLRGKVPLTVGYDPCPELLEHAPPILGVSWESGPPELFFFRNAKAFDVILVVMVLGNPGIDLERTVDGLSHVLAPGGTLFVIDHMADTQPPGKWWRFWPASVYVRLFERFGIKMTRIGEDRQLGNPVTILLGRYSG